MNQNFNISRPSREIFEAAQTALDGKTKPPRSMGRAEYLAARLCAIQNRIPPRLDTIEIVVFAGEHGVTKSRNVSAFPREVTAQMLENFAAGGAAICALSREIGANLHVVNVGVECGEVAGVERCVVACGTRDFLEGAAMTEAQAHSAFGVGFSKAQSCARGGADLLLFGEMGIGNTTSAAAILALLSGQSPENVVGRGTGVDEATLKNKIQVVRRAAQIHSASTAPQAILQSVGGLEIAALAGAVCGSATEKTGVLVDGFIVTVAAILAVQIAGDAVSDYLFFAHKGAENGHEIALAMLDATGENAPLLDWGFRLGEASGAALALPLLRGAVSLFEMASFESAGVSSGKVATEQISTGS